MMLRFGKVCEFRYHPLVNEGKLWYLKDVKPVPAQYSVVLHKLLNLMHKVNNKT